MLMQLAMIGLGRMGGNMARRLMRDGHQIVARDLFPEAVQRLVAEGATGSSDLRDMVAKLNKPRVCWCMIAPGKPTEDTIAELATLLEPGDIIIDGGNTFFKDDIRRASELQPRGIHYVDVGTSGGVWGLDRGYCLMYGGPADVTKTLEPIFRTLAPGKGSINPTPHRDGRNPTAEEGFLYCGPAGAGHFVKMIHNGIEYGLMQAYAEGFELFRAASLTPPPGEDAYKLPLADIAEVWRRGSVVGSWLLDLIAQALARDEKLDSFEGHVSDSGEGRWTLETAIEESVPMPVIAAALFTRFRSRQEGGTFAEKLLSAMRAGFGGHQEPK
jgi:6-phosphogluconate dehydrogenase